MGAVGIDGSVIDEVEGCKGIRVYKFNLDYVASIKWMGKLPFNVKIKGLHRVTTTQSMIMEEYLTHTDYALWEVIMNGHAPTSIASISGGAEATIPPKTTKQKISRRNELKAKSTLLLALPNDHLLKFHGIKDAKTLWEVIMTRFQKLISLLEIHGEVISHEDANLKLLISLPPAWNTHTLIMQNKSDLDTLNNTSSTNEAVNTAHDVFAGGYAYHEGEEIHKENMKESKFQWSQGNRNGDNTKRVIPVETSAKALVVTDEMGYDWRYQAEEGPIDFVLMAFSSLGSSISNNEVNTNTKECLKFYQILQKQYDQQREILNKLEARIVVHQKNEVVFEEDIVFLKYDVKVRDNSITELENQVEES
nr:hypothetical protein [Tanacetum cinerariifolium]